MKKIGFDFICKGHQHHTYMIGLFHYGACDEIYIDLSSNLSSPFSVLLKKNQKFIFQNFFFRIISLILQSLLTKNKIILIGINNYYLPLLIPLSLLKKIEIHLHGQIYLSYVRHKKIWKFLSNIFKLIIANPIAEVPKYFYLERDFSSFEFINSNKKNNKCLLYGSNKDYIHDKDIHKKILDNSYDLIFIPAKNDYLSWDKIINEALKCQYTFIKLSKRYNIVPSGRLGDLKILNLTPLVDKKDKTTINILKKRGIYHICI